MIEAFIITGMVLFAAVTGVVVYFASDLHEDQEDIKERMRDIRNANERTNREVYHKAKENEEAIKVVLNHLDLKVVEEYNTVTSYAFGEPYFTKRVPTGRRIEPKTENERRIDELQKEIDMLRELDKE